MQRLQVDYANYLLEFPWHAYHTQTFRTKRNDGHNAIQSTWQKLQGNLHWSRSFAAVERHKLGGVHVHYLLANDYDYSKWQIRATHNYMSKAFGFCHIEPARNQATVNLYCAKYVTKDNGDYYFLGNTWENPFFSRNPIDQIIRKPNENNYK